MWRPLSKLFETFAHLRLPMPATRIRVEVGDPSAQDALGTNAWHQYETAEKLYEVWSPVDGSPWRPFHCVTLFAALDRLGGRFWPTSAADVAIHEDEPWCSPLDPSSSPSPPPWLQSGSFVIVDLPGPKTVAVGSRLVALGAQPVCTFDNWPHQKGILKPELVISQLLRHAPIVAAARQRLRPTSPAVWLCDSDRLSGQNALPREFDNRYHLDDSVMPGPNLLRSTGVYRVIVVRAPGTHVVTEDLESYLIDLVKAGMPVLSLHGSDLYAEPTRLGLHEFKRPRRVGTRNAAGGFGVLIPEPSSSGG